MPQHAEIRARTERTIHRYEQFLETFRDNGGRITYTQIAYADRALSRKGVQSYVEILRAWVQASGRTSGRFADGDWTPVSESKLSARFIDGFPERCARRTCCALRDGMNLVAKEHLAAQDPEDPGVLVLSNLAGAARELSAALLVNPYDARDDGYAIQSALTMSLSERHATLLATMRTISGAWADRFVAAFCAVDHTAGRAA